MKAVVTGLPIMMVGSSEVSSMAVLKGSSSDVNTKVSSSGVVLLILMVQAVLKSGESSIGPGRTDSGAFHEVCRPTVHSIFQYVFLPLNV